MMSYGSTAGQLGGVAAQEPRLQMSAREAAKAVQELVGRLDRLLDRLCQCPPKPGEGGKDSAILGTLDAMLQRVNGGISRAHELLCEIETVI